MNIRDFVSEALRQLGDGVSEASGSKGILISPRPYMNEGENTAGGHMVADSCNRPIMLVEFDLAVAVHSKIDGKGSTDLMVLGFGGKGELAAGLDQTRVQRIKFQIPVAFPPPTNAA